MKNKLHLATLLLSTTLLTTPAILGNAYAHDVADANKSVQEVKKHHLHLSKEQHELLAGALKQVHEGNKEIYEAIGSLHDKLDDILTVPTFDKDAYLATVAQIEEKHEQIQKSQDDAFAAIANKFTPKQREHVAKLFSHQHHGWGHKGEHHEWHGKGHHHPIIGSVAPSTGEEAPTASVNSQSDYPPYSHR